MSEDVYTGLRAQLLEVEPADVGIERGNGEVWGGMMELGFPEGTATIVALADGTTSLYTSSGGGVIGGEGHDNVRFANRQFLAALEAARGELAPDPEAALPRPGEVTLRALTWDGRLAATASAEQELGEGTHPLSEAFFAGHDVITQLRVISEQQG